MSIGYAAAGLRPMLLAQDWLLGSRDCARKRDCGAGLGLGYGQLAVPEPEPADPDSVAASLADADAEALPEPRQPPKLRTFDPSSSPQAAAMVANANDSAAAVIIR